MPRRLRIGYARAVRMSGDGTTYAIAEQAAGTYVGRKIAAGQASYAVAGQDATLTPSVWIFSWGAVGGANSYAVGWDTVTHSSGDLDDAELYPNVVNVGTALSWTNNTGFTVYARVRSVVGTEVGMWSTAEAGPLTP